MCGFASEVRATSLLNLVTGSSPLGVNAGKLAKFQEQGCVYFPHFGVLRFQNDAGVCRFSLRLAGD